MSKCVYYFSIWITLKTDNCLFTWTDKTLYGLIRNSLSLKWKADYELKEHL